MRREGRPRAERVLSRGLSGSLRSGRPRDSAQPTCARPASAEHREAAPIRESHAGAHGWSREQHRGQYL